MNKGTALVTGASSGIGAVYCDQLAARGYDIILVARDTARLKAMATRLHKRTGQRIDVLTADLTDRVDLANVCKRLEIDTSISMLVNNAGMSIHGGWRTAREDELAQMLALNTLAPTLLARAAANAFEERTRGAIINIASVLALAPEEFDGAYSGTKAYLLNLTHALVAELEDKGVRVQAVLPCATRTKIFERSGKSLDNYPAEWVMEAADLVSAGMAGFDRGEIVTIPPLADVDLWAAALAARRAMIPHLQNGTVAKRYRSG